MIPPDGAILTLFFDRFDLDISNDELGKSDTYLVLC